MSDIERDFQKELEDELHRVLDPMSAMPIPPRRSAGKRIAARTVLGGAGAALTIKLLTGVAVAAAAVTVAGAATTGSINPAVWGQQVSQYVADCKAKLADGQHGIGDCVSDFSNQHGQGVASDARHQGSGSGSTNGHGNNSNANDHAKNKNRGPQTKGVSNQHEPTDPAVHATVTISPQP